MTTISKKDERGNFEFSVDANNILTIKVDMKKSLGISKTGKSQNIATTHGNVVLPTGERIGLNVFKPL